MSSRAFSMVKFCLRQAAECRGWAERTTDPSGKQAWLKIEGQWFFLARSYDTARRADGQPAYGAKIAERRSTAAK
jgi:hypothetical protein